MPANLTKIDPAGLHSRYLPGVSTPALGHAGFVERFFKFRIGN
jgi:hypothetical protein